MDSAEHDGASSMIAYHGSRQPAIRIVPASKTRDWMSGDGSFANRCLPMVVANQAGWLLLNTHRFTATWDGGSLRDSVSVEYDGVTPVTPPASAHFGLGVLTWTVPYLFRTPKGYNLLVRGPANMPKDGIAPLEGLVETDWSVATFTMNWKFTRPDSPITFDVDEPYCMIVPQRRGELESFRPALRNLSRDETLGAETKRWAQSRHEQQVRKFLAEYRADSKADLHSWEKDYYKGRTPSGSPATEHQSSLRLLEFEAGEMND
jgi:hypothetical protein